MESLHKKQRVTENKGQLSIDLNVANVFLGIGKMVDLTDQPKKDVHTVPDFFIDLCFRNEDMARLGHKVQVMSSLSSSKQDNSSSAKEDDFEKLGFVNGIQTLMFTKRNQPQCTDKRPRALGRSLFMKRSTDKNQINHDEDDADRLELKKKLREFVEQANARARIAKQEGKKAESRVTVFKKKKKAKKAKAKMLPLVQVLEASKAEAVFC